MSEIPSTPGVGRAVCRHIRSKEMFYEVEGQLDPLHSSGSGIYWCIHTQTCLGPDGKVAEPASCAVGRACFEAL
jgi:hypothetical protein